MFGDITDTVVNEVDMTLSEANTKIKEFRDSSMWNYVLLGTAFLTLIVAARNISIYVGEVKKLKSSTGGQI